MSLGKAVLLPIHGIQAAAAQPPHGFFSIRKWGFCQNEIFPTEYFKFVNAAFPLENYYNENFYLLLQFIGLCISMHSVPSQFLDTVLVFLTIFSSGHWCFMSHPPPSLSLPVQKPAASSHDDRTVEVIHAVLRRVAKVSTALDLVSCRES